MADRTQLRVANHNDIADDDPFAELTRIMGFDPRQPVKPQAKAPAEEASADDNFDIDLEKELMGEFGSDDDADEPMAATNTPEVGHRPDVEAVSAGEVDDDIVASLEHEFLIDQVEESTRSDPTSAVPESASHTGGASVRNTEVVISPADEVDDEIAASLEHEFMLDGDHTAESAGDAGTDYIPAQKPEAVSQQDDGIATPLEHMLHDDRSDKMAETAAGPEVAHVPEHELQAASADHPAPETAEDEFPFEDELSADDAHTVATQTHDRSAPVEADSDEDFAAYFDEAMTHAEADAETPELAAGEGPEDNFELRLDEELADGSEHAPAGEPAEEPAEQFAAPSAVEPDAPAEVAAEKEAPVVDADERTLEDELNKLLGNMSARGKSAAAESEAAPQPVTPRPAPQPMAPPVALQSVSPRVASSEPMTSAPENDPHEIMDLVDELDWDRDDEAASEPLKPEPQSVHAASEHDIGDHLLDELEAQDFSVESTSKAADAADEVEFDEEAFDAAFARSIDLDDNMTADVEPQPAAPEEDPVDSLKWLTSRSIASSPARSWNRGTPVAESAQPEAMSSGRDKQSEERVAAPAPAYYDDEMPDIETVDVPERIVALADDLDIPELDFDEEQPAASAYDDLDAEFASLINDMNSTDIAAAPARGNSYDDDAYEAGFNRRYEQDRVDARAYQEFRSGEMPGAAAATAFYDGVAEADHSADLGADDLPGSQPLSRADAFDMDDLDYDPELDDAMSVPGLAQSEAARRPRGRGLFVAAVVGAVAIAGGLGAFALSVGSKGGADAPVIVKADNSPIKVKPENPGGTVVPNQDNKVYDAVAKGAKPAEPTQEKLVTNTEEPVDVTKEPESRVVDLSPNDTDADAAPVPTPKSEDRIDQILQETEPAAKPETVAVAPRKVRTMVVKPDGSLVPRAEPEPVAPQVAATEPVDPAPQVVKPPANAKDETGTVPPAAATESAAVEQTDSPVTATPSTDEAAKPATTTTDQPTAETAAAPKTKSQAQSTTTPDTVPVAPPRPAEQPINVVGEVKPDQVASINPSASATAGAGTWSMQIASQPTAESAQSTYDALAKHYGSVLTGRGVNIVKADIAGKGTFYRVRIPAQSRNDAISLCTSYKAAGGTCFVSK